MTSNMTNLRNIALFGQETSGKTTLVERLLSRVKAVNSMGSVAQGNTVTDFEPEEKEQQKSLFPGVVTFKHKQAEITLVDCPGALDFFGQFLPVFRVVECGLCCIDSTSGLKITTRRVWKSMDEVSLPRMIVITRQDAENADFESIVGQIQEVFGPKAVPLYYPDGDGSAFTKVWSVLDPPEDAAEKVKSAREGLVETVVESDEKLLEKYFEEAEISEEELAGALRNALTAGELFPIVVTSAEKDIGVQELLDEIADICPPSGAIKRTGTKGEEEIAVSECDGFVGQVFKVWADDFLGRLSYIRILSGEMKANSSFTNMTTGETSKYGNVIELFGKEHHNRKSMGAGRIAGIGKVDGLVPGDTVVEPGMEFKLPGIKFPTPLVSLAVRSQERGDEQKLSGGLRDACVEDPCIVSRFDEETGQRVISGLSDFHLNTMLKRMKRRRKVDLETKLPLIPYRETVTKPVKYVEYTHKKQSGGAGQFARVFVDLEPMERGEGYEFVDKIFGGSIDQPFRPSVDKGIQAKMKEGVLAGYPVVDVRVSLVDGKTHPVDSKDIAFQIAGREVFKKAFMVAEPVLLEPLCRAEISVPQRYMGDIMGDLNGRRGRILDTRNEGDMAVITAQIPVAEIQTYPSDLNSMTGGEGTYEVEFDRYDIVPSYLQDDIVQKAKAAKEEARS